MNKDKKKIIDDYIIREILKTSAKISVELLFKYLSKKYLNFLEINNIQFKDKNEEQMIKDYFKKKYIKEIKKSNK